MLCACRPESTFEAMGCDEQKRLVTSSTANATEVECTTFPERKRGARGDHHRELVGFVADHPGLVAFRALSLVGPSAISVIITVLFDLPRYCPERERHHAEVN